MNLDQLLYKAHQDGLMDIETTRFYSRLIFIAENQLFLNKKKKVTIREKDLEKVYVDHVRKNFTMR